MSKSLKQQIIDLKWFSPIKLRDILLDILLNTSKTKQIDVTGDVVLTEDYNNCIVKVKNSCTITIPKGLSTEFGCVLRTYTGVTAEFENADGVQMDAPRGLILEEHKMATLFKDGNIETFILEGELTT